MNHISSFWLLVIGLLIFSTGCESDGKETPKSNENLQQLKTEWEMKYAAWKALNIQNYQFTLILGDTGTVEKMTIKNGVLENAIDVISGESCGPFRETIDALFDSMNNDFSRDENLIFQDGQIGTYFSVLYEPEYHYPIKYTVIYKFEKKHGIQNGNGATIEITDFTLLEE